MGARGWAGATLVRIADAGEGGLALPMLLSLFWLSWSEVGAGAAEVAALVPLLGSLLVVAVRRSGIKMGRPILFLQAGGSSLIKF